MRFPFVNAVCSVACLIGGVPTQVVAQDVSPVVVGERVRAHTLEGATHDGFVRTLDETELGLQIGQDGGELLLLPLTSLEWLEVQRGQKSAVSKGVCIIGALVGGGLGAVTAVQLCASSNCTIVDVAPLVVAVGVVALGFSVIGALVGAPFKTDRWEEVPMSPRPDVRLRPSGRLEWSVSFPVGR